ncbi:MAG: segregation/condensation protein A [Phycisphaerales bacterium]|nr:segregation/condensation protein A [Phycisphaerales bacterium]
MNDYRVDVDSYNGPLDLLLFLIRRQEVSIHDIPIARVAEQYRSFVGVIQLIDPNLAGEFLVMLASLMELKSAALLPRAPESSDAGVDEPLDPRSDLIRQLMAYKSFKDAARRLGTAAEIQALRFPRQPADAPAEPGEVDVEDVSIWTLVNAFSNLLDQIGKTKGFHEVVYDETPLTLHADDIVDSLQREGGSQVFESIFTGRNKAEMIGLFLAMLELIRQRRIRVTQEVLFGPITIHLVDPTPLDEVVEGVSGSMDGSVDSNVAAPFGARFGASDGEDESAVEAGDAWGDAQNPTGDSVDDDDGDAAGVFDGRSGLVEAHGGAVDGEPVGTNGKSPSRATESREPTA